MIRRPPRSTLSSSSAASDVYKRQVSTQSTGLHSSDMSSVTEILNGLKSQITPAMVKKTKTVFVFDIGGKVFTLDLKNGAGKLEEGKPKKADCTLIMTEAVFMELFTGKMNPQTGFMQGKYKIKGNLMASQKLAALMKGK
eukprot:TRINITY_DN134_c0_g1_i4.p2 TRINITY_DN134_c0_g1~~TRINITY_DN134_c0_g1_i4.p2  ORF type:complete len:140 (-),score=65.03 TRINITY_DN134_c0_g1_i4:337-756(-)